MNERKNIGELIRAGLRARWAGEFGQPSHEFGDPCGCPACEAEAILRFEEPEE